MHRGPRCTHADRARCLCSQLHRHPCPQFWLAQLLAERSNHAHRPAMGRATGGRSAAQQTWRSRGSASRAAEERRAEKGRTHGHRDGAAGTGDRIDHGRGRGRPAAGCAGGHRSTGRAVVTCGDHRHAGRTHAAGIACDRRIGCHRNHHLQRAVASVGRPAVREPESAKARERKAAQKGKRNCPVQSRPSQGAEMHSHGQGMARQGPGVVLLPTSTPLHIETGGFTHRIRRRRCTRRRRTHRLQFAHDHHVRIQIPLRNPPRV